MGLAARRMTTPRSGRGALHAAQLSLSTSPSQQHGVAIGIAIVAVAARVFVSWRTHSTGEDALITLRYAQNYASGRGFVYNPGEHVMGVTTPLYCLLLSLFQSLHLHALACGKAINIAADGLTCYLLARLMARPEIGRPVEGLFAAAIYALTSTPISVSIGGMETGIVTCVGFAMIYAYIAKREMWLYGLGAVLFLLRIDGLLLFMFLTVALAIRERKPAPRAGALFLILVIPWLIYATAQFGSPVPTSLVAKITVYSHPSFAPQHARFTPTNVEAFKAQFLTGWPQRVVTALFAIGAVMLFCLAVARESRGVLLAPVLWCLLYFAVMLTSRVPAFPWYFLPPWPVVVMVACLAGAAGVERFAKLYPEPTNSLGPRVLPAVLGGMLLLGLLHLRGVSAEVAEAQRVEDTLRMPVGLWLRDHVAEGERVMLEPIGYIGYYSRCRVLDTIGLVSPEVLSSYKKEGDPRADIIRRLKPEWLCLRKAESASLAETYRLTGVDPLADYAISDRFQTPGAEPFIVYRLKLISPLRRID